MTKIRPQLCMTHILVVLTLDLTQSQASQGTLKAHGRLPLLLSLLF